MNGAPGRLEVIAAIVTVAGLVMAARAAWRVLRAIRSRFTYGAPYRTGMIADRALGLAMSLPVPAIGLLLAFFAWGQAGFQTEEGSTVRVGRIEARRSGWGRIDVRFVPDPLYPAHRVLEAEISGARWAVAGDFISWDRGVRWLGFRDGQRVRYLLGARDTTGLSPGGSGETTEIESLPTGAACLLRMAPFIPFLKVRTEASRWLPLADLTVMTLYAIGPGYIAETASESAPGRAP
jgi:hypothetical protein